MTVLTVEGAAISGLPAGTDHAPGGAVLLDMLQIKSRISYNVLFVICFLIIINFEFFKLLN
jgi:hypothetical protein